MPSRPAPQVPHEPPSRGGVGLPSARGLSRVQAARYIGVSPSTFDRLVADGRMPPPIPVNARRVWDLRALDRAFDRLAGAGPLADPDAPGQDEEPNPWDAVFHGTAVRRGG